ncbi:MAG: alpha/beta fold hydrolase [Mycobacteriales bacterium]
MTLKRLPGKGESPLPPWPGRTVDIDGQRLFVRHAGAGVPAVFVHGLGGSATNWTDLMGLLADEYDGHALDLPGFGRSAPPVAGDYGIDAHVRAVRGYLEQTFDEPVHLFGNSLGGAVAVRLAATAPGLVRTLTLVSPALPSYRPKVGSDPRMPMLLVPGLASVVVRGLSRHSAQRRTEAVIDLCFADPSGIAPERREEAIEEMRSRRSAAWYADALTLSLRGIVLEYVKPGRAYLWRQAASLRMPTLVVHGRRDRLVPFAVGQRAARVIPGARFVAADASGHVAQLEQPELVARAFLDMIANQPTAAQV